MTSSYDGMQDAQIRQTSGFRYLKHKLCQFIAVNVTSILTSSDVQLWLWKWWFFVQPFSCLQNAHSACKHDSLHDPMLGCLNCVEKKRVTSRWICRWYHWNLQFVLLFWFLDNIQKIYSLKWCSSAVVTYHKWKATRPPGTTPKKWTHSSQFETDVFHISPYYATTATLQKKIAVYLRK